MVGNDSWINQLETRCVHFQLQKTSFIPLIQRPYTLWLIFISIEIQTQIWDYLCDGQDEYLKVDEIDFTQSDPNRSMCLISCCKQGHSMRTEILHFYSSTTVHIPQRVKTMPVEFIFWKNNYENWDIGHHKNNKLGLMIYEIFLFYNLFLVGDYKRNIMSSVFTNGFEGLGVTHKKGDILVSYLLRLFQHRFHVVLYRIKVILGSLIHPIESVHLNCKNTLKMYVWPGVVWRRITWDKKNHRNSWVYFTELKYVVWKLTL